MVNRSMGSSSIGYSRAVTLTPAPPAPGDTSVLAGRPKTSATAVIALVAGALALVPVAVVLGIVALFRIQRYQLRGRRLAVVALSICAGWTALAMVGIIGAAAYVGSKSGPLTTFKTGTCFMYSDGLDAQGGVDVIDCSKPHDGQIVGQYHLGGSYPGLERSRVQSSLGCTATAAQEIADAGRLGDAARLNVYYPASQASWDDGMRSATCVLTNVDHVSLYGDARDRSWLTPQQARVLALTNQSSILRMKLRYLSGESWQIAAALEARLATVDRAEATAALAQAQVSPGGASADGLPSLLTLLARADQKEGGEAQAAASEATSMDGWQSVVSDETATSPQARSAYQNVRAAVGLPL
jgi:hypothetical protein